MSKETASNYLLLNSIITETGCREWTGPINRDGYGQIGSDKVFREFGIKGAHRLMVHLSGHEFTGRHEQVMHLCHNRRCIAQEHLRVGTAKENIAMALERGSHVGGKKLSHSDVLMIRALDALLAGRRWIAARFGVDKTVIQKIATGKVWAKVTHEPDTSLADMQAAAAAMIAEAESLAEVVRTRRFARKAVA